MQSRSISTLALLTLSCATAPPPAPPASPPPPPPSAQTVPEDEIRAERADIRSFEERFTAELSRVNNNLGACFESDPDASGQIALTLVLDEEGTSKNTRLRSSDLLEEITECLLEAMRGMRDVKPPGRGLELPLPPFTFERGRDVTSKM